MRARTLPAADVLSDVQDNIHGSMPARDCHYIDTEARNRRSLYHPLPPPKTYREQSGQGACHQHSSASPEEAGGRRTGAREPLPPPSRPLPPSHRHSAPGNQDCN
ncbi:unnamed protein product [Leptosia nina]|uniref:Uncharacterized protein n=1 Tax=Leptosia nina TaxID=320188 RepID=A0AAV1IXY4_9NEOP